LRATALAIDLSTLYVVAALVAATLGSLLLLFGQQERIAALRWWGGAYLAGALAIGTWAVGGDRIPDGLMLLFNMTGFVACGLVWVAAGVFRGRKPNVMLASVGALIWLAAVMLIDDLPRTLVGAAIVAAYAGLTVSELWCDRRRAMRRRWAAVFVPALHGMVLMAPILIGQWEAEGTLVGMRGAWTVAFALQLVLYAIGTVVVVIMMAAERAVSFHKSAAVRDPLTGLLNRRGFSEACARLAAHQGDNPVTVMIFDLDHFKGINDKFGHPTGDDILRVFASVVGNTLRATDIIGRIGGEEFAAFLPCATEEATLAAERVRAAFEGCGAVANGVAVSTTVSIGMAGAAATAALDHLLASADKALYRSKTSGRNRYTIAQADDFADQRGRIAMPAAETAIDPVRKAMIRLPHLLPTLDPETSHLPLQP
jgi:diguanylate cyclase (GGDEF)-like protein